MEVHSSNLALFEPPAVESAVESIEWVHFAPLVIPKTGSALEFNISSNATTCTDLSKTLLQVKVKITRPDGSEIGPDDDVALANLVLNSLFGQCDVSLNQRTINTSAGSNYPYKAYFDVILDSIHYEAETVLQNELFYKDTAGAMDGTGLAGNNLGHYDRQIHTKSGKTVVLEGPIRMDICQQERLVVNGVKLKLKFSQMDNAFRLTGSDNTPYKVNIVDSVLKICQVKLKPQVLVAQNETLTSTPALYPIWSSNLKSYNIQQGNYEWGIEDVYRGSLPNNIVLALCSSEAYSGRFTKNPFNFNHYNLNCLEVTVNGAPTPFEPLKVNFEQGDYTSCYLTLFNHNEKTRGLIERKGYPNGYCIFKFALQS